MARTVEHDRKQDKEKIGVKLTTVGGNDTQRLTVERRKLIPRITGRLSPRESVGNVVQVNTFLGNVLRWTIPTTR